MPSHPKSGKQGPSNFKKFLKSAQYQALLENEMRGPSYKPRPSTYEEALEAEYHRNNPDPDHLKADLEAINEDMTSLQTMWARSHERKTIIEFLENRIIPMKDIRIENALCLGLGTFENSSYQQFLIFETVVDALRKRFDIKNVAFQDPSFSAADIAFLKQRGHLVITYPASMSAQPNRPFDQKGLAPYSGTSFLYAPYLSRTCLVPAVCTLKPPLYLGTAFYQFVDDSFDWLTHITPKIEIDDHARVRAEFEAIMWSCEYRHFPIAGSAQGFHWSRDPKDESALERVRARVRAEGEFKARMRGNLQKFNESQKSDGAAKPGVSDEASRRE